MVEDWYKIENSNLIDSPSLLVYKDRVEYNIEWALNFIREPKNLRPHIKTHKNPYIVGLCQNKGIQKFKCATISEAEILGEAGVKDVLLAYPIIGPKINRWINLINNYPETHFSCLVDRNEAADELSIIGERHCIKISIYIDLNIGMNRTGMLPNKSALELYLLSLSMPGIRIMGYHVYDGHIINHDLEARKIEWENSMKPVLDILSKLNQSGFKPQLIAGGSTSFPFNAKEINRDSSPGTFVYWDYGYMNKYSEMGFIPAALVLTRVISQTRKNQYCLDLGYKSISSERPIFERVYFLNIPSPKFISQSEEHLIIELEDNFILNIGDILYGIPYHICPTVALYESIYLIENHNFLREEPNLSRNRKINF